MWFIQIFTVVLILNGSFASLCLVVLYFVSLFDYLSPVDIQVYHFVFCFIFEAFECLEYKYLK